MARTLHIKQARPTDEDFKIVVDFLYWLERYMVEHIEFVTDEDGEEIERELSPSEFLDRLEDQFHASHGPSFYAVWERVLWGGKCAIDNACDPDSSVLEWNKNIENALRGEQSFRSMYTAPSRRHGDRLAEVLA